MSGFRPSPDGEDEGEEGVGGRESSPLVTPPGRSFDFTALSDFARASRALVGAHLVSPTSTTEAAEPSVLEHLFFFKRGG